MCGVELEQVARLVRERNTLDEEIAGIIGRPVATGHLGEWIAARVFRIALEASAAAPGIDGRFTTGSLQGRTVNVKWYLKREGVLDVTESAAPDYYLVLAGPSSAAASSRGGTRPWCIASVHLFDAELLLGELRTRGVEIGVASSVRVAQWEAAEVYPRANNKMLPLEPEQAGRLRLFAPA